MGVKQRLLIVGPGAGELVDIGGLGVHFKVSGGQTHGAISIVEHPMQPGRMAPPHIHRDEDELSCVLEGTFGVRVGDEVGYAGPGSYVWKPRGVAHTFWNEGPGDARLIEIIVPAGFEDFFARLAEAAAAAGSPGEFDAVRTRLGGEYHLDFVPEWIEEMKARYNVKLLGER
jgi:mannose-6-phosphate isomerase-like protein (cupin superfamily)